jgi:hypothetical protein
MSFLKYDEFLIETASTNKHIMIIEKVRNKNVESSHLKELKYDDDTKILEIEFNNGSKYQYFDVPKKIYQDLAEEQNILRKIGAGIAKGARKLFGKQVKEGTYGTRFWDLIRRGGFEYEKIKE